LERSVVYTSPQRPLQRVAASNARSSGARVGEMMPLRQV
jgi:hypothetical protein